MSKDVPELPKELEAVKEKAVEIITRNGEITPEAVSKLTVQKTVTVEKRDFL